VLALPGGKAPAPGTPDPLETLADLYGLELDAGDAAHAAAAGSALLARPRQDRALRPFALGPRDTPHVRHWHKYFAGFLPPSLHFQFRGDSGEVRHVARNVGDLHRVLELCAPDVVRFHAARRDVSRWLRGAIQDESLADAAGELERRFAASAQRDADVAALRRRLLLAIEQRYVDGGR
jgi:hypothetical protein